MAALGTIKRESLTTAFIQLEKQARIVESSTPPKTMVSMAMVMDDAVYASNLFHLRHSGLIFPPFHT